MFAPYGAITSVAIIKDKITGQSRGFGFVEMAEKEAGTAAVTALNGKDLKGRPLTVNEARPKPEGGRGGSGGGSRGGNRGGGRGRGGNRGGSRGGGGRDSGPSWGTW